MNSSASNATANEKTIPATTAINVIAICITSFLLNVLRIRPPTLYRRMNTNLHGIDK